MIKCVAGLRRKRLFAHSRHATFTITLAVRDMSVTKI
jgi:hypothetical protein